MRVVMLFDLPAMREAIQAAVPDADILTLPPPGQLASMGAVDAVLATPGASQALGQLLAQHPEIRWIHVLGTGIDDYPLELLHGRQVTCSRGATTVPIAEWVMAMILAQAKNLPFSWVTQPPPHWCLAQLDTLEGKTLGILGFGNIGQAIARRALGFDMTVRVAMRTHRPAAMAGVESVPDIDELITTADHLVLALPATALTEGLMSADRLSLMKRGSHLINVSRGTLVDTRALREHLDSGQIARASLDVANPEPLPAGHWLYQHPQVQLSPHISWNSPLSQQRMSEAFIDNLLRFASGAELNGVIDTQAGY